MSEMRTLALDYGNKTGWARSGPKGVESGVVDFTPRPEDPPGLRWIRFSDWLRLDVLPGVELVVYERWTASPGIAAKISAGYVCLIEEQAARLSIPTLEMSPAALKRWLTGSGRASKGDMRAKVINEGWVPTPRHEALTDDEADALALLHYGMECVPERR